mgnify:CR=1 FL=1
MIVITIVIISVHQRATAPPTAPSAAGQPRKRIIGRKAKGKSPRDAPAVSPPREEERYFALSWSEEDLSGLPQLKPGDCLALQPRAMSARRAPAASPLVLSKYEVSQLAFYVHMPPDYNPGVLVSNDADSFFFFVGTMPPHATRVVPFIEYHAHLLQLVESADPSDRWPMQGLVRRSGASAAPSGRRRIYRLAS